MSTTDRLAKLMPFIFEAEGETYENVPGDAGGPTKFGVDQRSHPNLDIRNLTKAQALEIYREEWDACGAAKLKAPLGECYFDCVVNCGKSRADKILALSRSANDFCTNRSTFYMNLATAKPALKKFLKGWLARVSNLRKFLNVR